MKFANGCWLKKEGVEFYAPAQVYDEKLLCEGKVLRLYAPANVIYNRGCTLGGVVITIKITAPKRGIFGISLSHYEGISDKYPKFDIDIEDAEKLDILHIDGNTVINNGAAKLVIDSSLNMKFYSGDRYLTGIYAKDMAYVTVDAGIDNDGYRKNTAYMNAAVNLSVGEHIYGLGERFTEFVKNGQSVDMWNADGGTFTEQAYKNVPFFMSDRGYGVFVNETGKVMYEVGSEYVRKASFCVKKENISFFIICGEDNEYGYMKDVLVKYTGLSGRPPVLPAWSFGLWLSTSFTTDYNEETVMEFIDGMKKRNIPLSVFHFDCFWMQGMKWCNFIWDKDVFPDPRKMLKRIKDKGLRICVWINPYIAQNSELFSEGAERGYFIKRTNGDVWQWDMWQPGMAIVDFTNPSAVTWYQEKLKELLDMGVSCFKTDFGERIPTDGVVYYNGADPEGMHNYYSYLYNKAVYEAVKDKRGEKEAILFARSATCGGQKFPVHWGGDCTAEYESMAESLRGGLSLTMSGFSFWSHDIGGFEDTSTADVYKRWVAFGLMSSHSRMHGSSSYRVPWNYGDEAAEVASFFSKVKNKLMPYIYSYACQASENGIPLMRSMVLEFPEDKNCSYLDRQYMLGPDLLVAPVFNERGDVSVYLPNGCWTDYFTGDTYEGGKWYDFKNVSYFMIPCFVREGAVIPIGSRDDRPDYDYMDGLTLNVYKLYDGMNKSVILYNSKGERENVIDIKVKDGVVHSNFKNKITVQP